MDVPNAIKLFENKKIRVQWNEKDEKWYFSIVDVIQVLTDSSIPRRYWSDLKINLKEEGFELYDKIVQLKTLAPKVFAQGEGQIVTPLSRNKNLFATYDFGRIKPKV